MAIVKAGGYGSDSVEIAKKLESIGVDYFAVAFTNEGIDLRKAGIKTPILVLLPQVESIKNIIDYKKLKPVLEKIQTNIANYNNEEILNILTENVEGFDRWKKNLFLL